MYKNTANAVNAFRNNTTFRGPNSRVVVAEENGAPIITIFSYELKVGEKRGGAFGEIRILPSPLPGTLPEAGGSKTSRALISGLWLAYPTASRLR